MITTSNTAYALRSQFRLTSKLLASLPVLMSAMLFATSVAATGIAGDTTACFVEGMTTQIEIHPGVHQPEVLSERTVMFSNAVTTPVTVTCPLNVHPALDIEGAVVEVIELKRAAHARATGDSMAAFTCALMSRAADGGQASGRRVTRNHPGPIYLPQAEQTQPSTLESNEARYRYIQCELPGYSAIRQFSTEVAVSDAAIIERSKLVEALKEAQLEFAGEAGINDSPVRTGNRFDLQ